MGTSLLITRQWSIAKFEGLCSICLNKTNSNALKCEQSLYIIDDNLFNRLIVDYFDMTRFYLGSNI